MFAPGFCNQLTPRDSLRFASGHGFSRAATTKQRMRLQPLRDALAFERVS
jgi:hypothetical protein